MSATWRPAPQACARPRCTRLHRLAAAAMIGAFVALGALIAIPLALAIIPLALLFAAGAGLAALGFWLGGRCRHDSDLEALADATREPRHELAGQRFTGLRGHFQAWEEEMDWPGQPARCTCTRFVVDTLEETLGCPGEWRYMAGAGWIHPPPARRRL